MIKSANPDGMNIFSRFAAGGLFFPGCLLLSGCLAPQSAPPIASQYATLQANYNDAQHRYIDALEKRIQELEEQEKKAQKQPTIPKSTANPSLDSTHE